MNIIKKLFLLSVISVAFALPAYGSVTTDVEKERVVYEDNFNDKTAKENWSGTSDPGRYGSDTFYKSSSGNKEKGAVVDGAGPDGSKALKSFKQGDDKVFATVAIPGLTDETKVNLMSFDIKFDFSSIGATFYIGGYTNRNGSVAQSMAVSTSGNVTAYKGTSSRESTGYTLTLGTWYKVIQFDDGENVHIWLLKDGEVVADGYNATASDSYNSFAMTKFTSACANKGHAYIDNVKVVSYNAVDFAPAVEESSLKDVDLTNVPRNQKLVFTFDQFISEESEVTLSDESGIVGEASIIMPGTVVVSYEGLLERGTEYTLSFSNVKNNFDLECDNESITFTTENLHPWNDVVVSAAEQNAEDATLTDITFTFGEKYGYPDFTGAVLAVSYENGIMVGADMVELSEEEVGEITCSFDLGDISGTQIKLILVDTLEHPIPLASGSLAN